MHLIFKSADRKNAWLSHTLEILRLFMETFHITLISSFCHLEYNIVPFFDRFLGEKHHHLWWLYRKKTFFISGIYIVR